MKNVWLQKHDPKVKLQNRLHRFVSDHIFEQVDRVLLDKFEREFEGHKVEIQVSFNSITQCVTATWFLVDDISLHVGPCSRC